MLEDASAVNLSRIATRRTNHIASQPLELVCQHQCLQTVTDDVLEGVAAFAMELLVPGAGELSAALHPSIEGIKLIVERINGCLDVDYTPSASGPWAGTCQQTCRLFKRCVPTCNPVIQACHPLHKTHMARRAH
jgi:hypothetical protein